jgi:hypothetical protein
MRTGTNFIYLFVLLVAASAFSSANSERNEKIGSSNISKADTTKNSPVVADGATIKLVSKDFVFSEGPASNKKGEVFFSDQPNDKIWKYGLDGKLCFWARPAGPTECILIKKEIS